MHIVHIISSMDPASGGPPVVAASIAAAQQSLGHRVTILSREFDNYQKAMDDSLAAIPNAQSVEYTMLPARNQWIYPLYFTTDLGPAIASADMVHLHGVWNPILYGAAIVAYRLEKPYVVQLHGMLDPWSMSQRRKKKVFALSVMYRKMLNRAAFLHCLNSDEADLIAPLDLTAPREVIGNGIFLESLSEVPPKGDFYSKFPELGNSPYILFMSRLHMKKGLDFLADAFAIVNKIRPDVHLVVAGPDQGEQQPFEFHIKHLGLSDKTHLVGPIYGPQKYGAIQDAAVFCLPSRQEGFSIAITEALSIGTPVVISKACHFPEVEEVGAGYITPLEPEAIAKSILDILSDPHKSHTMGQQGIQLIRDRYTWDKIATQLITAYQKHI